MGWADKPRPGRPVNVNDDLTGYEFFINCQQKSILTREDAVVNDGYVNLYFGLYVLLLWLIFDVTERPKRAPARGLYASMNTLRQADDDRARFCHRD